ncbi:MAG: hypothetical protein KDA81_02300 [Planctomycetaceae bacterium]|nr:hypothetical protein [Planctomycetaceae bacterium]
MDLILGLVFLLCLMFLAMLFGERLSLYGAIDGRWLTAPFDAAADFWDMTCEATDRLWCFVADHFWWVAATLSGGIGVLLIALIMVSGLSREAKAVRQDESSLLYAGGVLDHTPLLNAEQVLMTSTAFQRESEISQLMYQVPSEDRFAIPATIRRPIVQDIPSERYIPPRAYDVPPLAVTQPSWPTAPLSRSRLSISMEPFIERVGRPVRSPELAQLIQRTVQNLRNDDWMTFSQVQRQLQDRAAQSLPESSEASVRNLESQVRVIPGAAVSSNSLLVEKSIPDDSTTGQFDIQIQITNRSRDELNGLIVRELLPFSWKPVQMQPEGVFRESVVTWLVDRLRPGDQEVVTLRVNSGDSGRYQSITEVSAVSAVVAQARVRENLRWNDVPPERTLPVVERPDVELILVEPPQTVAVGQWVDVRFRVRNKGTAAAEGVVLRVELPFGLDHHDLTDLDSDRRVNASIARLAAGETREMVLSVRPTSRGRHFAVAELVLKNESLTLRDFELLARESGIGGSQPGGSAPLTPRPDFSTPAF